jgi:putative sterol carrier protein
MDNTRITFDCREYLGTVLPALLQRSRTPRLGKEVVIQFVITDREGCDRFYVISDGGLEVGEGVADKVDLTLGFAADDLSTFSRFELDVDRALGTSRLKVMGDTALVGWLSSRLQAPPNTAGGKRP